MAIRTVAPGGGNFGVAATWVGGVAPVAGDGIVADATSGNLTLAANTVSLISADFTGYTGTLALAGNQFAFNTAGAAFLTLGSGMTITTSGGYFRCQVSMTVTSNGKPAPFAFNNTGATFTLVGTATATLLNQTQGIITGADLIFTGTTISDLSTLVMATGYKFYLRPSGTLTLNTAGLPRGYFVFDTNNTITITAPLNLQPSLTVQTAQTIEFAKAPVWSGAGTTGGRPYLRYNLTNSAFTGSTFSMVMTTDVSISDLYVYQLNNLTVNYNFPTKIISQNIFFLTQPATTSISKSTMNIKGAGGFSASNVYIDNTRDLNNTGYNSAIVKLSSDATYEIGNLLVSGTNLTTPFTSILSSLTASVPTTVSITNGGYAYAQITDINNIGTPQYALTANGNTLTRTTGFTSSVGGGGGVAGGSFTFVN